MASMGRVGRQLQQYSKFWKQLSDTDYQDRSFCKKYIERDFYKHDAKTQRGLYQGKEDKSGNSYCFSDKKFRRKIKVNAHHRIYRSEILNKKLEIKCSTNAMKTIRKYGGIDNYILLMKETKLKSTYGEYLRELMFRKIINPEMPVPEVLRDPTYKVHFKKHARQLKKWRKKVNNSLWIPPEIRHTDLSENYELPEEHIPLREVRKYEELKHKIFNKEDINFDDEYVKKVKADYESRNDGEAALLEEANNNYNKLFPSRFLKRSYKEHLKEAREFQSKHPIDIF